MALGITRKYGQSIFIGDEVKITLNKPKKNHDGATMIIEAPISIQVIREELLRKAAGKFKCDCCDQELANHEYEILAVREKGMSFLYSCKLCGMANARQIPVGNVRK